MPGIYDDELQEKLYDWTVKHRTDYLQTGGVKGHLMDMRMIGSYRIEPMCLIRYVGRKSGKEMVTGLGYVQYGPEIIIVASLGGADVSPQWYHNIKAGGPLDFQIATQAFNTSWRELDGDEYEDAWTFVARSNPAFGQYRKATTRKIPLIAMTALDEIPVFTDPDA